MTAKVVAVVGHVDHGKTSLVKALTGTDTDTLEEERRRGLTISLGFAPYTSNQGTAHLIDAPGHADFLRTTVSGVSGADAILLVVSAVDGVQAQTLEHLEVARLLAIETVIVAVTKADIAAREQISDVNAQVRKVLTDGAFTETQIVTCSARSQYDLVALKRALDAFLSRPSKRIALPGYYLPIDRAFSITGAGTIVTGTLLGGELGKDQSAILQPHQSKVTIRALQMNGRHVDLAEQGSRSAVNLKGVSAKEISKGDVLCSDGAFSRSDRFDVVVDQWSSAFAQPKHMEVITVLHGTGHASARVRRLSPGDQDQQSSLYAQLEFDTPQIAFAGQRCLLRRASSAQILAGGRILDPVAKPVGRLKRQHIAVLEAACLRDPLSIARALAARDGGAVMTRDIMRLAGLEREQIAACLKSEFDQAGKGIAIDRSAIETTRHKYLGQLATLHAQQPAQPFMSVAEVYRALGPVHPAVLEHVETHLHATRQVISNPGLVALAAHDPLAALSKEQIAAMDRFEDDLKAMALLPKNYSDLLSEYRGAEGLVELLVWAGKTVRLYNHSLGQHVLLHTESVASAREALISAFPHDQLFRPSEARKLLNTNRKVIIPLLEYFDHVGVTIKSEEGRRVAR